MVMLVETIFPGADDASLVTSLRVLRVARLMKTNAQVSALQRSH